MSKKSVLCVAPTQLKAGRIVEQLANAGFPDDDVQVAGAASGDITEALVGIGLPESMAKVYEDDLETGSILISVFTEQATAAEAAKRIFHATGAAHIATTGETARATRFTWRSWRATNQFDPPN